MFLMQLSTPKRGTWKIHNHRGHLHDWIPRRSNNRKIRPDSNHISFQQRSVDRKYKFHHIWGQEILPQHLNGLSRIHENLSQTRTTKNYWWIQRFTTSKERFCILWNHQRNVRTTSGRATHKLITHKTTSKIWYLKKTQGYYAIKSVKSNLH